MERDLESKKWYRTVKVLAVVFLILAFFAPALTGSYTGAGWFLDGLINVGAWLIILALAKTALLYIVFGSKK